MKIERKWKYGHNMPHTLNIFFCRDLKKVHFIFQTPLTVKIEKWWGGYHPLGWNLLKMGGNSPPGWISPPFPFCQIWEGGGYHHLFRKLCKMGGISHLGGISPPCPYMASVNGCLVNIIWSKTPKHKLTPKHGCKIDSCADFVLLVIWKASHQLSANFSDLSVDRTICY